MKLFYNNDFIVFKILQLLTNKNAFRYATTWTVKMNENVQNKSENKSNDGMAFLQSEEIEMLWVFFSWNESIVGIISPNSTRPIKIGANRSH